MRQQLTATSTALRRNRAAHNRQQAARARHDMPHMAGRAPQAHTASDRTRRPRRQGRHRGPDRRRSRHHLRRAASATADAIQNAAFIITSSGEMSWSSKTAPDTLGSQQPRRRSRKRSAGPCGIASHTADRAPPSRCGAGSRRSTRAAAARHARPRARASRGARPRGARAHPCADAAFAARASSRLGPKLTSEMLSSPVFRLEKG
jgi:hypothetical protein